MLGFNHAFRGLYNVLRTERNFKIQLLAFLLVVVLGFVFQITIDDWIALLLVSGIVLSLEIVNSAIERLCDLYSTKENKQIKLIKDISAGAVLLAALFAIIVGVLVFYPYLV